MRYALCSASDQLLLMLRRWIRTMASRASTETAPKVADIQAELREFATAVRKIAGDRKLTAQAWDGGWRCLTLDGDEQEVDLARCGDLVETSRRFFPLRPSGAPND